MTQLTESQVQWAIGIAITLLGALIVGAVAMFRMSFVIGKLVAKVDGKLETLEEKAKDHEERVRTLEGTGPHARVRLSEAE